MKHHRIPLRVLELAVYLGAALFGAFFASSLATATSDGSLCPELYDHMEVEISQADPSWLASSPKAAADQFVAHVRTGATDRIGAVYAPLAPSDGLVREGRTDLVSAADGLITDRGFFTIESDGNGFLVTEATICLDADEVTSDSVPSDVQESPHDSMSAVDGMS
jgi:hypothetical protein